MTKDELVLAVKNATAVLETAQIALETFVRAPENNVFLSLLEAEATLYETLRDRASDDCEGSHNCGASEYRQGFFVDGKQWWAIATVEYNRHDKTYHYVDEFDLRIEPA